MVGRVRNTKTRRNLKANPGSHGYLAVSLCKKGVVKTHCIHKLLAQEWVANPDKKKCVDHIDGDKLNNHWGSLRWATYSENSRNQKNQINKSSFYKGVSLHKQSKKWTFSCIIFCRNNGKCVVSFEKHLVISLETDNSFSNHAVEWLKWTFDLGWIPKAI